MLRNMFAALLVGPPVCALAIFAVPLTLGIIANPLIIVTGIVAVPAFLVYALFGAYLVGWLPALIGGALNGLVQHFVHTDGTRRLVAGWLGFVITVFTITPHNSLAEFIRMLPMGMLFGVAGAIAALASNGLAGKIGRAMAAAR